MKKIVILLIITIVLVSTSLVSAQIHKGYGKLIFGEDQNNVKDLITKYTNDKAVKKTYQFYSINLDILTECGLEEYSEMLGFFNKYQSYLKWLDNEIVKNSDYSRTGGEKYNFTVNKLCKQYIVDKKNWNENFTVLSFDKKVFIVKKTFIEDEVMDVINILDLKYSDKKTEPEELTDYTKTIYQDDDTIIIVKKYKNLEKNKCDIYWIDLKTAKNEFLNYLQAIYKLESTYVEKIIKPRTESGKDLF